jgi:hypothetical protein
MLYVQHIVNSCSEDVLDGWEGYLESKSYDLPLQLLKELRREKISSNVLCIRLYGISSDESKRKFKQLCQQLTFHFSFVCTNYPYFLSELLLKIQSQIQLKNKYRVIDLLESGLKVARKIEDFESELNLLKLRTRILSIEESRDRIGVVQNRIQELLTAQQLCFEIRSRIYECFDFRNKHLIEEKKDISVHVNFFNQYTSHDSVKIKVLALYGLTNAYSFVNHPQFYSEQLADQIKSLKKLRENHPYILFVYEDDLLINIDYLELKCMLKSGSEEEIIKVSDRMLNHWQESSFWKSHLNVPQSVALSVMISHYATKYCNVYREDYLDNMPVADLDQLKLLESRCFEFMNSIDENKYTIRYINTNNFWAMTCILQGDKQRIKKAIERVNTMLYSYQQASFQKLYDSIFVTLSMGLFCLKRYDELADAFKRYQKLSKNLKRIAENDIMIHAFYYAGQYLNEGRDQYISKLNKLINENRSQPHLKMTIHNVQQLADYYSIN